MQIRKQDPKDCYNTCKTCNRIFNLEEKNFCENFPMPLKATRQIRDDG